ncbi:MAG: hypothetical protein EZS28_037295, partial [Streblomastix strix]
MIDRNVLVEELIGEQPAKDDKIEIKADSKVYKCINIRMRCKRVKSLGINIKTLNQEIGQRSKRVIKVVDGRGLFNQNGGKDKTKIEIDRWSRHSESADTVRENYDVNNNDSIRKALSECVS